MALNFSLVQLSAFSTNLLQEQNHFLSECLKSSCDELIRILKYFRYLDVPMVERERRAWQGDMPVEEVPPKIILSCKHSITVYEPHNYWACCRAHALTQVGEYECKCTIGDLEFIAEGHTKPDAKAYVSELAVQGLIAKK